MNMDIDVYEVVMKLIGPVEPVGETHTDNKRYENLKELTQITESLLTDISNIESRYKNNRQYSMKQASEYCAVFLNKNGIPEQPTRGKQ